MPMVLRQFFVTLEHKAPLRPGPMGLAHSLREGAGLIAADACEVVWQMLLQLVHRLPDLRDRPLGAEFGVAITVDLTPSQGSADKVACQPDTVRQNGKGGVRIRHIVRTEIDALISQSFNDLHHPVQRTIDIGEKFLRGYGHPISPHRHMWRHHCTRRARCRRTPGRLRHAPLHTGMTTHCPVNLPATALVLEEVLAGRQPGDMIPQLSRVLTSRNRGDDWPKET